MEDLEVSVVSPHKFNGCGLVISSEVIKSGVNIPKSVFFVQVLGNSIGEKMTKRIKIEDDIRPSDRNQEVYEYINTATWSSAPWLRSLDVVS
mgnify:CR=1 FL=1